MSDLLLGHATASLRVKYVTESTGPGLKVVDLQLEPRDWDVLDPAARTQAAREELGGDYEWYLHVKGAQWWIYEPENAAGLAIYRDPKLSDVRR